MKFLEILSFQQMSTLLDGVDSICGDSRIFGRLEAYSCKRAGSDKKLYKSLEEQYQVQLSKSPDLVEVASSPFGPLSESSSRKTLIYLISILNTVFPDYDFSNTTGEQFRKESSHYMAINSINTMLSNVLENYATDIAPKVWGPLDTELGLKDCDIYSYAPDIDSDPYSEEGEAPAIWSFHYFFYNKKLRRILYFTCRAVSKICVDSVDRLSSEQYDEEGPWLINESNMEL